MKKKEYFECRKTSCICNDEKTRVCEGLESEPDSFESCPFFKEIVKVKDISVTEPIMEENHPIVYEDSKKIRYEWMPVHQEFRKISKPMTRKNNFIKPANETNK